MGSPNAFRLYHYAQLELKENTDLFRNGKDFSAARNLDIPCLGNSLHDAFLSWHLSSLSVQIISYKRVNPKLP